MSRDEPTQPQAQARTPTAVQYVCCMCSEAGNNARCAPLATIC